MAQVLCQTARLFSLLCLCAFGLASQASVPEERVRIVPRAQVSAPQSLLRVDASLVLIPVHVTTSLGSPVMGLKQENFAVFEDGVPQTITHFSQDDAPVSVGVLLDISGSMKNKMVRAAAAAEALFQFANAEDEFFLVEFNHRPKLKVPFTSDWAEVSLEIARAKASGLTALVDAIHLAVTHMREARNARRALVILSDGGDNYSRRTIRQLRSVLSESDVQIYSMGIFDSDSTISKHSREERNGPGLLKQISIETGGHEFPVRNADELSVTSVQIARNLRNQYVLGYSPANLTTDGKYRRVNLVLALPEPEAGLRSYYRRGYYAPLR